MDVLTNTTLRPRSTASSLPDTLLMSTLTPCQGQQNLSKINESAYSGTVGDFTVVNLYSIQDGGDDSWALQVVNFDQSPPGCFGFTNYRLKTPSDDPVGPYCLWNGSSKDCNAGQAAVATV